MGVRFTLPANAADAVTTTYSPLSELALSLRVLGFPHRHPQKHAWVRSARRLAPELRRRMHAFRFAFRCGIPDSLFPPNGEPPAFAAELERIRSLDPAVLASELEDMVRQDKRLRGSNGTKLSGRRLVAAAIATYGPDEADQAAAVRLLATDRRRAVEEFLLLLEDYWEASFAEEWLEVEPLLARANVELEAELRHDFYSTVSQLQHRLHGDSATCSIAVDVEADRTIATDADRRLLFVPSTFLWPHVMAKFEPAEFPGLLYPAHVARAKAVDLELIKVAKALGDGTRLRALKLLAQKPRTTQDLAPLLGITESGLSKHLRALAEVGLVRTRRKSYYVIYSVVPDRIASLSSEILTFLDDAKPGFASGESVAASANE